MCNSAAILTSTNSDTDLWLIRDFDTMSLGSRLWRIATICIRINSTTSALFVPKPRRKKDDVVKDAFYDDVYDQCRAHGTKNVLEDFNAKVRQEGIFDRTYLGREDESIHWIGATSCCRQAEAWNLLSTDAAALRVFERKNLRKIFGKVRVGDDFLESVQEKKPT